jgi:hypothetical protein
MRITNPKINLKTFVVCFEKKCRYLNQEACEGENLMTAAQYVSQYHSISVPEYRMQNGEMRASHFASTPVDEYLNLKHTNRAGYTHKQRMKFRNGVYEFLEAHAPRTDTPVYRLGAGYKILNSIAPCAYVDFAMFESAFVGKAPPETLYPVIQALSYWRGWRVLEEGTPPPSLARLVDMFLGSDCNGFVGNYMKEKYKANEFRLGPSTPEEDYFYNRDEIRDSGTEIRADDVVLLNRTPDPDKGEVKVNWDLPKKSLEDELTKRRFLIGHIMVISSVGATSDKSASVMISESATSAIENGGPRTTAQTLQRIGTYRWKILGKDREVHSVIKVKRTG